MKKEWQRIAAWLKEHAPDILTDMNPAATEEQIDWAEQQLGHTFPGDVREWYSTHNGSTSCALLEYWDFYSLCRFRDFLPVKQRG
ncbi:MAG: SMI1/KNR4 family protein [Gemmataceae bacterium]